MLACLIYVEINARIIFVRVGWCEGDKQALWLGDPNVVQEFGKLGEVLMAKRVVHAESHASAGNEFPIGGAIMVAEGFAGGYK